MNRRAAFSNRSIPQPWKSKSIGLVAAWMKPHSAQPYSEHSDWSSTRARNAGVRVCPGPRRDQLVDLLARQVALGRGVAELEGGVVVAGVLVVDQPDPLAVVDEVAGEQVVVARDGRPAGGGQRAAYAFPLRREAVVPGGQGEPVLAHEREVARLAGEHVEVVDEPRPGLQPPDGGGDPRR